MLLNNYKMYILAQFILDLKQKVILLYNYETYII